MLGNTVTHPQFGQGQVTATFRNGAEWLVRFENGLRLRRSAHEFREYAALAPAKSRVSFVPSPTMTHSQREARHIVEALRVGIAPAQQIDDLTIGLRSERASLAAALTQAHKNGGAVRAVVGEYGFGKSHLVELAAHEGLERNFLVTTVSLDLLELPPHRAFDIYAEAMRNVRYPDTDERGLEPLLTRSAETDQRMLQMRDLSPAQVDPIVLALNAIHNSRSSRARQAWIDWLMGGRRVKPMNKGVPRGIKFPSIYKVGHNARQIAFLLTGMSALARLANYSGLCVLVDEAESYSLLRPYQRPKASTFFQAVIYAALRDQQNTIEPDQFPQHRFRDYPLAYDVGQSLFFLFTVTRSDNRMPLDNWLSEEQIFNLAPSVTPQEVGQFVERVMALHARAYGYTVEDRQRQVRRGSAELLAQGIRNGRLSMRLTSRLTVELYDLLYLYPNYDAATLLDELREQVI